jgi:hypothetical protein
VAEALGGDPATPVSLNACSYAYARPSMLVDPFGLDPDPKRCRSLSRRVANTITELAKRKKELELDPLNLVETNPEEVLKHQELFAKRQEDLFNRMAEWEKEGCDNSDGGSGLPADVWDWALAPIPSRLPRVSAPGVDTASVVRGAGTVALGAGVGYGIYRVVRFLPSLLPPLWETIPFNLAIP